MPSTADVFWWHVEQLTAFGLPPYVFPVFCKYELLISWIALPPCEVLVWHCVQFTPPPGRLELWLTLPVWQMVQSVAL